MAESIAQNSKWVDLAYQWHGGQGSDFYSYASTGGKVWSGSHAAGIAAECRANIRALDTHRDGYERDGMDIPEEAARLKEFEAWADKLAEEHATEDD